ncbi:MAG: UDP-N-acetylmuramoyl-tripeptide--D-alanyl-D-alanine ligase [Lachnospiraceae bacterium]|nr:UDP-N-acetylmuramoyl-tripeptide--D-alanyl-D-alanine ligase [Lachnospiraceae bacterium]
MNLTIGEIAGAAGGEVHISAGDTEKKVSCVVIDSRIVSEGGVFIAAPGEKTDGHKYIEGVLEKKASLIICEKNPEEVEKEYGLPSSKWGSYIVVEDAYEALRNIASTYRDKLAIPVVGITGSVGKTSTKEFIAGTLSAKYNVLKTEGNYNNTIGVPLTILKVREEHTAAVIEMGISEFGEMTVLTGIAKPDIAVITNIGECHLENLGDRDGVLKAKTEIFKSLSPKGKAVLYAGDDKLRTVTLDGERSVHFFGFDPAVVGELDEADEVKRDVSISAIIKEDISGSDIKLRLPGGADAEVHVPMPGRHMMINAAAAATVGCLLGLSRDEIRDGIGSVTEAAGRNRFVKTDKLTILDDCYNANPASMRSSIDLLMKTEGGHVLILGDMFELGADTAKLHAGVGEYAAASGADIIIFIGDLSANAYRACEERFSKQSMAVSDKVSSSPSGRITEHYKTKGDFLGVLANKKDALLPNGSSVLVKASHGMHFEEIVEALKAL